MTIGDKLLVVCQVIFVASLFFAAWMLIDIWLCALDVRKRVKAIEERLYEILPEPPDGSS
jgi:hypothetical protein